MTSTSDGTIFRGTTGTSAVKVFEPAGTDGRTTAIGLEVTTAGDRLVVAGGDKGAVHVYDTKDGRLVGRYTNGTGATFLNDVAIARNGDAYVTDSTRPLLYRIPAAEIARGTGATRPLQVFRDFSGTAFRYVDGFNANGIVISQDGTKAVVVQSGTGKLFSVDLRTKAVRQVDLGGKTLVNGDGLELRGNVLYVNRNANGVISKVKLAPDATRGTVYGQVHEPDLPLPDHERLLRRPAARRQQPVRRPLRGRQAEAVHRLRADQPVARLMGGQAGHSPVMAAPRTTDRSDSDTGRATSSRPPKTSTAARRSTPSPGWASPAAAWCGWSSALLARRHRPRRPGPGRPGRGAAGDRRQAVRRGAARRAGRRLPRLRALARADRRRRPPRRGQPHRQAAAVGGQGAALPGARRQRRAVPARGRRRRPDLVADGAAHGRSRRALAGRASSGSPSSASAACLVRRALQGEHAKKIEAWKVPAGRARPAVRTGTVGLVGRGLVVALVGVVPRRRRRAGRPAGGQGPRRRPAQRWRSSPRAPACSASRSLALLGYAALVASSRRRSTATTAPRAERLPEQHGGAQRVLGAHQHVAHLARPHLVVVGRRTPASCHVRHAAPAQRRRRQRHVHHELGGQRVVEQEQPVDEQHGRAAGSGRTRRPGAAVALGVPQRAAGSVPPASSTSRRSAPASSQRSRKSCASSRPCSKRSPAGRRKSPRRHPHAAPARRREPVDEGRRAAREPTPSTQHPRRVGQRREPGDEVGRQRLAACGGATAGSAAAGQLGGQRHAGSVADSTTSRARSCTLRPRERATLRSRSKASRGVLCWRSVSTPIACSTTTRAARACSSCLTDSRSWPTSSSGSSAARPGGRRG